jgi:hypothetical protein
MAQQYAVVGRKLLGGVIALKVGCHLGEVEGKIAHRAMRKIKLSKYRSDKELLGNWTY